MGPNLWMSPVTQSTPLPKGVCAWPDPWKNRNERLGTGEAVSWRSFSATRDEPQAEMSAGKWVEFAVEVQ